MPGVAEASSGIPLLACLPPLRVARARSSVGDRAKTSWTVSLNARMLANPAAKATSLMGRGLVSMRTLAVWALWARARASGPAPTSASELALDLADAEAEPAGQAGHTLTINDTVRDEPHGPRDQVGAHVPLRRPGTGVGPAALAGPKTRLLGRGRAGIEAKVLQVGPGRAARAAVDACGHHGAEEPPVEACVPGPYGALAGFGVLMHIHQHALSRRLGLAKIRHQRWRVISSIR